MRVLGLLLLVVGACRASTTTEQQQQEASFGAATWAARLARLNRNLARRVEFRSDSPGTETVLLVKGGVGVDVDLRQDLLSTKNIFKKPVHHTIKARFQPKRVPAAPVVAHIAKSEARTDAVDEEVAGVSEAADVAQKLAQQLKHEAKQVEATKKEYRKVQKENVALKEKLAKEEAALKLAEADVASQKKQNAEFAKEKKALWNKVHSLDEDLRITNEAWKERAEVEEDELEAEEKKENNVAKKAAVATTKKTSKKSAAKPQKNNVKVVPKKEQKTKDARKLFDSAKDTTVQKQTTKFSTGLKAAMTKAIASVAQSFAKKASTPKKLAPLPPAPAAGEYNEKQDESEDDLDDDEDNEDEDAPKPPAVEATVEESEEDDSDSEKEEDDGSDE